MPLIGSGWQVGAFRNRSCRCGGISVYNTVVYTPLILCNSVVIFGTG